MSTNQTNKILVATLTTPKGDIQAKLKVACMQADSNDDVNIIKPGSQWEKQLPLPTDLNAYEFTGTDASKSVVENYPPTGSYNLSGNTNKSGETIKPVDSGTIDIDANLPDSIPWAPPKSAIQRAPEKQITRLYWISDENENEIKTITFNEKARLCFETQGYQEGETVFAIVKRKSGRKIADNSTELIYSGVVDKNGKAISNEIYNYSVVDSIGNDGGKSADDLTGLPLSGIADENSKAQTGDYNSAGNIENDHQTTSQDSGGGKTATDNRMKPAATGVSSGDNASTDAQTMPATAPGKKTKNGEKKVTKFYWIDAKTKEEIKTVAPGQKARLCFETQNYQQGERLEAKVIWDDGRKFEDNTTELTFSGIVDANGKAISEKMYTNTNGIYGIENNDTQTKDNSVEDETKSIKIGRIIRGNPYVPRGARYVGLPDSLPLNKTYEVKVEVEGKQAVELAVINSNSSNGSATVTPSKITATTTVTITGTGMTKPGYGGHLRIAAKVNGIVKATSAGFSVCCHPVNFRDTYKGDVYDPDRLGVIVSDDWDSDNGVFADLSGTEIKEVVSYDGKYDSPPFQRNRSFSNSGYIAGNIRTQDTHSMPRGGLILTAEGVNEANQISIYRCNCCGAVRVAMPNSGLKRMHKIYKRSELWKHQTEKKGATVTMGNYTIGSGNADVCSPEHDLP